MKHESNEVKQLCGQLATYFSHAVNDPLPNPVLKCLVPALVMGTKEKNTVVKGNSEYGLLALLHLQDGESTYEVRVFIKIKSAFNVFVFYDVTTRSLVHAHKCLPAQSDEAVGYAKCISSEG